jgi:hypothetical protein
MATDNTLDHIMHLDRLEKWGNSIDGPLFGFFDQSISGAI